MFDLLLICCTASCATCLYVVYLHLSVICYTVIFLRPPSVRDLLSPSDSPILTLKNVLPKKKSMQTSGTRHTASTSTCWHFAFGAMLS